MPDPRTVWLQVEPDGTIWTKGPSGPITFWHPQDLWNFCTLDVSRDRNFYPRPRMRNEEEERAAVAAWCENNRPPSAEEMKVLILQKVREQMDER